MPESSSAITTAGSPIVFCHARSAWIPDPTIASYSEIESSTSLGTKLHRFHCPAYPGSFGQLAGEERSASSGGGQSAWAVAEKQSRAPVRRNRRNLIGADHIESGVPRRQ